MFRKPFTPEELKAILDAAQDDDFIRPLIVTGICAAMPDFLTGAPPGAKQDKQDQIRQLLEEMTPKTIKRDKARLLALLDGQE